MSYVPPTGWIETRVVGTQPGSADSSSLRRFHIDPACPRITDNSGLQQVDKPYSAARCMLCASDLPRPARSAAAAPEPPRAISA
jgi:hypothetical protein